MLLYLQQVKKQCLLWDIFSQMYKKYFKALTILSDKHLNELENEKRS